MKTNKMTARLNTLPTDVQDRIIDTLKAYDEITVSYEYGMYHFGVCIKSHYAPDHRVIGTFHADDIFTPEERMLNYMESFHEYPPRYTGKRDWKMIQEIGNDWSIKFKWEDGNIVRA